MSSTPIVERFRAMAVALAAHPAIQVTVATFQPPATPAEFAAARQTADLPPAMLDFYRQANGLRIGWEHRHPPDLPAGGLASGSINLLPVQRVFGDWGDTIALSDDDPFRPLHPFDFFVEEACAALYLDGSPNPPVHYHILGEETRPLGVDFAGYLELLLKSRGFWYWPEAIAPSWPTTFEAGNFRAIMPRLFPDYRAADFVPLRPPDQTGTRR